MNKLHSILLIACVSIGFASCSDDDCEDLHLDNLAHYPNVLKGTFPTENQVLNMGETLEITPKLLNPEIQLIPGSSMEKNIPMNTLSAIR